MFSSVTLVILHISFFVKLLILTAALFPLFFADDLGSVKDIFLIGYILKVIVDSFSDVRISFFVSPYITIDNLLVFFFVCFMAVTSFIGRC